MGKVKEVSLVAVDNGGYSTCIYNGRDLEVIPSEKGVYVERYLESNQGEHDYVLEVGRDKYMLGTLAKESRFPLEMHTDSKDNEFYKLSVLLGVSLLGGEDNVVVVSVPIVMHREDEKRRIREGLEGDWEVVLNGSKKRFNIRKVLVVPETVTCFWNEMPSGKVRWIDWGSRTIGYGTTINERNKMRFSNKDSGTFEKYGLSAKEVDESDIKYLVDYVGGKLLAKWNKDDRVINVGGGAEIDGLLERIMMYFNNSEVVKDPQTYLVKGMYNLGIEVLGDEFRR